jgi:hypothetical protein
VASALPDPERSLLEICPHFDRAYWMRRKSGILRRNQILSDMEVIGGPRLRTFYPDYKDLGPARATMRRLLRKLKRHRIGRALGLAKTSLGSAIAPDLTKVPLIKGRRGLHWVSNHRTTPLRLSSITGALLHFKFLADFHARAIDEAARGQHWNGAAEYARYASLLAKNPDLSFFYEGSETYRSPAQLVALGIMRSSPELAAAAGAQLAEGQASESFGEAPDPACARVA